MPLDKVAQQAEDKANVNEQSGEIEMINDADIETAEFEAVAALADSGWCVQCTAERALQEPDERAWSGRCEECHDAMVAEIQEADRMAGAWDR